MDVDETVEESPEEEMEYTDATSSARVPLSSTSSISTPLKTPPGSEFANKIVSD